MNAPALQAVIFDLDGVLLITEELHYRSWKEAVEAKGIAFERAMMPRLRGRSRSESLEIILRSADSPCTEDEKAALAQRKNERYLESLKNLTPADLTPGALALVHELRRADLRTAVGSSSRNARLILEHLRLADLFDAIVDGNDITASKPDPAVFRRCAELLGVLPSTCLVIEDAPAGIEAARRAGMIALGIGDAAELAGAARICSHLENVTIDFLRRLVGA